ncbi:MAG: hypothetical protein JW936_06760 [Sedimentisphaerales bacterium]|nr:hypothetical protein [Sedimentisphaerales bacterium]
MKFYHYIFVIFVTGCLALALGIGTAALLLPKQLQASQRIPFVFHNPIEPADFEDFAQNQCRIIYDRLAHNTDPPLADYITFSAALTSTTTGQIEIILDCPADFASTNTLRRLAQRYLAYYHNTAEPGSAPQPPERLPAMYRVIKPSHSQYRLAGVVAGIVVLISISGSILKSVAAAKKRPRVTPKSAPSPTPPSKTPAPKNQSAQWSPKYDLLADRIEQLRTTIESPIILISPFTENDISPRPAVNLGIALSRRNHNVIIIDIDPKHPHLSSVFELPDEPGLVDYLKNPKDAETAIQATQLPHLNIMTSGKNGTVHPLAHTENPQELPCWQQLRQRFDAIILHYPQPLHKSQQQESDCPMEKLLQIANGVFCVTRRRNHIKQQTKQAQAYLAGHPAQLLGFTTLQN